MWDRSEATLLEGAWGKRGGEIPHYWSRRRYLPGGEMLLGSRAPDALASEGPPRRIRLSPFYLDVAPVTNRQYLAYLTAEGRDEVLPLVSAGAVSADELDPEHPVVGASWGEAMAYAVWAGGALPSEAQWEYAASLWGSGERKRRFPWGDAPFSADMPQANLRRGGGECLSRPGEFGSWFGFDDLGGNVWEWCCDSWSSRGYEAIEEGATDPIAQDEKAEGRVLRGGSFQSDPIQARGTARLHRPMGFRHITVGFRVAYAVGRMHLRCTELQSGWEKSGVAGR